MTEFDRNKWNRKFAAREMASPDPSPSVTCLQTHLPKNGRALDLAGGAGRHSIWMAQQGLDVAIADISRNGLDLAAERARQAGITLELLETDLQPDTTEQTTIAHGVPAGPWDVILSHYYCCRKIVPELINELAENGRLIIIHATVRNLERHSKPPRDFLLREKELPSLVHPLSIRHYSEGWTDDGRHEGAVVAVRDAI